MGNVITAKPMRFCFNCILKRNSLYILYTTFFNLNLYLCIVLFAVYNTA